MSNDTKSVVSINLTNSGSTGNIMRNVSKCANLKGFKVFNAYPGNGQNIKSEKTDIHLCNILLNKCNRYISYISGFNGCSAWFSTWAFLLKLNRIKPTILHLHNLHNSYINLPMLFNYIKKHDIKVVWTLHDCWSFTGQCPYFTLAKCEKWKTGCHDCPQIHSYPASMVDRTITMWNLKKKWFTGIKDMTIVTPSQWLADLVKQSYLKDYPVMVINNGIDLTVFKPTKSGFRTKYHLEDKYILLGVAFGWGRRKGLDVFIDLANRLDDRFQIVLVGTNDEIDKQLPENIISIHRTNNQHELAEIYSAADLFVNPTREENYPTVNMESIACGTPVLTFRTGGSPEIPDEKTGYVVDVDDIDEMEKQIIRICTQRVFSVSDCIDRAKMFDNNCRFMEYIHLYNKFGGVVGDF